MFIQGSSVVAPILFLSVNFYTFAAVKKHPIDLGSCITFNKMFDYGTF